VNIQLFTTQLNQLLQANLQANTEPLDGVCDLLRSHTAASVCIRGKDGAILAEVLAETGEQTLTIGCITLRRGGNAFTEEERLAVNIALCVCTVLIRHREEAASAEKQRRAKAVRSIINSLSFSELEAATQIFAALKNNEGLLVAGHIADNLGVARSVVTGALRKLEGANLIETRSLGMKGTYIRVKNTLLTEEFAKL
jgi:GTP-sensing pleiotropic transcriptional regulator CodY